ncbi:MAG TPA: NAD(P)-binding protein [Microthrixaceae bacterium]|nr:NAD(P)-binding protein [Microthrixaceae bacterium]
MTEPRRRDVAVLGGGMAALATAWRLSDPARRDRIGRITVYQRGWRLGGKGASSRGINGRIEEHGLHVWLGYYDNAFRLMRDCYDALDRERTDPECPIRTWTDAFSPAPAVGLASDPHESRSDQPGSGHRERQWTAMFTPNSTLPGEPVVDAAPMTPVELLTRGLTLVADFARSVEAPPTAGRVVLSARRTPPPGPAPGWAIAIRQAANLAVAAALELSALGASGADAAAASAGLDPLVGLGAPLSAARDQLRRMVGDDPARRRWFELLDLVVTSLRGIVTDGLLVDPRGLRAIDGEEFCDWLRRHGAASETFSSPLVLGVYDLAFAAQDGDPSRRRFSAGTGLYLSALMYFGYHGSIFWKMNAGMGDVVFAPLHDALRDRGVRFEFFHQVDELVPGDTTIDTIRLTRQLSPIGDTYDPLVRVGGVRCFPDVPVADRVAGVAPERPRELETHGGPTPAGHESIELVRGEDFDDVVLAMSIGMVPLTCARLVERDPRWAEMVRRVGTVATQSFQLWMRESDAELGLPATGVTLTGGRKPFDTTASMSHLIDVEQWPHEDRPKSIVYFCSTLDERDIAGEAHPDDGVHGRAVHFLDHLVEPVLPGATTPDGFRWEVLCGEADRAGSDRFDTQYWTANVDPSDRYVQSLPGSGRARIRPDDSGWSNLALAGDWTDCGLNVGCIEAATVSGLQAANALLDRDRWDAISGYWEPIDRR